MTCDLSDPNMLGIGDNGECICNNGYRTIEVDKLGYQITAQAGADATDPFTLKAMKCEACPAG